MSVVYPPGPFPPSGSEPEGVIDLAIRLRDEVFSREWLEEVARPDLTDKLRQTLSTGDLTGAAAVLEAFLATWPVASVIDDARQTWTEAPDAEALAVLVRAAEIACVAEGWSTGDGPWPVPDAAWIEAQCGDPEPTYAERDLELPPHVELPGEMLAANREALCARLAHAEIVAVRFSSPVPDDVPGKLALGEVRMAGLRQANLERYGLVGLLVDDIPSFDDLLATPEPGQTGATLRTTCDWAAVPGTPRDLAESQLRPVTYLLWDAPIRPVAIDASVTPILGAFRNGASLDQSAEVTETDRERVEAVVSQLVAVGALTTGT